MEEATQARLTTRHYEQAQSVRFSPKHTYSAMFQARPAATAHISPVKQQQEQTQADGEHIPAFRPGGQALGHLQTLPAQQARSYTNLAAAKSPPRVVDASEPAPCMSPPDNVSEMSTVQRAVNAAIADSVQFMLCTPPPEAGFQAAAAGSSLQQQGQQRQPWTSPSNEVEALPSVVSISPFGYLEVGPRSTAQAGAAASASEMPAPPAEPTLPPAPSMSDSLVQALSPTFMTSHSKPLLCELDDPGSAIRFRKQHRGSRFQRLFGRIMPCFAPHPEPEQLLAFGTPLPGTARSRQGRSPELPTLAIPIEPLRRSVASLPGSGIAGEAVQCPAQGAAPAGAAAQAGPAAQQAPGPSGGRQSPPCADLLGLLDVEPNDVIINIASPVLPSQPNSCFASQCATPAEQLVATNLLSARQGVTGGEAAAVPDQGHHAKRNLLDLLHSRAEGFGVAVQPVQQATAAQAQPPGLAQPSGEDNLSQGMGVYLEGSDQDVGALVGLNGAALPLQQQAKPPPQQPQRTDTAAQTLQQLLQQYGRAGGQVGTFSEVGSADAHLAAVLEGQLLQPRPAVARPRRTSPRKSPVKHTVISISQLLAKRRNSSPGSAKKRLQQQQGHGARHGALQQAPDLKALQAQRQLVAAKVPPINRRPGASSGRLRGAPAGKRDLSKPLYRSAALHAMLSPGQAMQPRTQSTSAHARQQGVLLASFSAPSSPRGRVQASGAAKQATVSLPSSPVSHAQLTQPTIPPRMNKASAARMAALQRKLGPKHPPAPAGTPGSAQVPAAAAAAMPVPAAGRLARQLASPEHTARPHYRQGAATPTHTIPAIAAGEAGVEPYSARPAVVRHNPAPSAAAAAPVSAALAPAPAEDSSLRLNYQADRAEYLQILTQLALGLDVNPEVIARFKASSQPTLPPLPPGMLEAAAAQSRREEDSRAVTVRPRDVAADAVRPGRVTQGGRASTAGSRAAPAAGSRAAPAAGSRPSTVAQGGSVPAAIYVAQRSMAGLEEEGLDSCSQLTTKTLVYSLASVASSSELAGSDGALTPHSNDLYQSLEDTGSPKPAAAQRLRSFTAAVQRARRSEEERWQLLGGSGGGWQPEPAGFDQAALPSDSQLADLTGHKGAVTSAAAGQQMVSKPAWARQ